MNEVMMAAFRDELQKIAVSGKVLADAMGMFGETAGRKAFKIPSIARLGKAPRPNIGKAMGSVSRKAPPPPKMLGAVSRKAPPPPKPLGPVSRKAPPAPGTGGLFETRGPSPWQVR